MFDSICERTRRSSRRRWLKCDIQKTNLNSFYRSFFFLLFFIHWSYFASVIAHLICFSGYFASDLSDFFHIIFSDEHNWPNKLFQILTIQHLVKQFFMNQKKTKKSRSDIFQNHFLSLVSLIIFTPLTRDLKECFFSLLNFFIAASSFYMWCITHSSSS